jgi:uncharacterized metal-binding protein YceD (DUF177 family)
VKVHLNQIPPDGLHLQGEEDCPMPELEPEGIRCAGPVRYNLEIGISGPSIWANGSLVQPVEMQCVSCLERFVQEIRVPQFAFMRDIHGPEAVDLTPLMREDILLNLPSHPHCDADETRKCKGATRVENAGEGREDAAAKREHDWGALDRLKSKLKN